MSQTIFDEIAQLIESGAAPGGAVVLRSSDDNTTGQFAHGTFAGPGSPTVAVSTVYDVASITKLFTTALVLRLHEQNKLSIGDRCADYLANFQESNLRLLDLLTHRAPIERISDKSDRNNSRP